MISTHWLEQRKPYWTRLEALLDATDRGGLGRLTRAELQELGLLYRQIAADLATVREDPGSGRFSAYLNQLLARAHHAVYQSDESRAAEVARFLRVTFPRAFRAHLGYCAVACLLFTAAAVVGAALTYRDPDFKTRILGPEMVDTIQRHEMWTHSIVSIKPFASSRIMTNNLSVSFAAFALGITAGLGTIYLMIFNGLLMGVIGAACAQSEMGLQLWSFVAPHGVLELPAIIIAGGAGLRIAHGVLFPGLLPRRASIARAGGEAVRLLLGCVPILVIAAVVEAFVSPTDLAVSAKLSLAAALFVLLAAYLMSAPRAGSAA